MNDIWSEFTPAPPRSASQQSAGSDDPWAEFTPAPASSGGVRTIPAQNGRPARVIMDMGSSRSEQEPDDTSPPGMTSDVIKSVGGGLVRGTAGLLGLPALAGDYLERGADYLASTIVGESDEDYKQRRSERRNNTIFPGALEAISPDGIQRGIETLTGPAYKPQTTPGQFASTAAEFVPGGAIGKLPNLLRNILAFGVVPGLTSEAGGQAFKGSAMETPARIAGGVLGGFGSAGAMRMGSADRLVRKATEGVTRAELDAAEELIQAAQQQGVQISRAEALQAVTQGRTGIGDLQHTVEGMGGMRDFYAQRPMQNEAAARGAFDNISILPVEPSQIGPTVGSVARQTVQESPEAAILADTLFRAGPRVTPEQAGATIQSELRNVYDRREGMRAALADQDYNAARNAPATIPLNGGYRVADVDIHYHDRPDIPIILDQAERNAAKTQWFKDNNPKVRMPIVGERATEFGQVDASSVLRHLDGALDTAKGAVRQGLKAARSALLKPDGTLDMSVAGLHNSREAINDLISQAKRAGANHTVARLMDTRNALDRALEQVPAYDTARKNFQAASRPLEPFEGNRAPGRIVEREQYNNHFALPPESATAVLEQGGPSAVRDFNSVATPAAREAFEQNIVTQVLDRATRDGADLSAESIRQALRQNEDVLRQYPGVRDRLESVAIAREGLAKIEKLPIGKLAQKDMGTRKAINALFPSNPSPNSQHEIAAAMTELARRNPRVARELVRVHAESVFNEAAQRLASGGPAQGGGAKFAAVLRGNPQQAANLEAAIKALPSGDQIWPGFNRFLEVMEAQQFRQTIGSRTAFKGPAVDQLKGGGLTNSTVQIVGGGGLKLPQKVMDAIQNWNVGRNLDQLSSVLTDPNAASAFRAMVDAPSGSAKAAALATRILYLSVNAKRAGSRDTGTSAR